MQQTIGSPKVDGKPDLDALSNLSIPGENISTALDVWNHVTGNEPVHDQIFCSINLEHSEMDQPVKDGDEVAFFPPVTGG